MGTMEGNTEKDGYIEQAVNRTGFITKEAITAASDKADRIAANTRKKAVIKNTKKRKQNIRNANKPDNKGLTSDVKEVKEKSGKVSKSLLGISGDKSVPARSKLLGKNKQSAIRKATEIKSLRNKTFTDSGTYSEKKMQTAIINEIKKKNIQKIAMTQSARHKSVLAGKSPVQKIVSVLELLIKDCLKIVSKGVLAVVSLFAPFIVITITLIVLVISLAVGVNFESQNDIAAGVYNGSDEAVAGCVKSVRNSLTYDEVHKIPWYSSASPFTGDIGLDKLSGDRGGNCTAYAWGRRCEIEGKRTELGAAGNACAWYDREVNAGIYECGQTARVGAVCCWSYNAAGGNPGHVAVIEEINTDGSIIVSNSAYGSSTGIPILFYLTTYNSESELKNAYYHFNGYIYVERVSGDDEDPKQEESVEGGVTK